MEAAGPSGDEDVACSVAVLDEDGSCSVAVFFLSKPAAVSNATAAAMEEERMLCSNLQSSSEVCSMLEPIYYRAKSTQVYASPRRLGNSRQVKASRRRRASREAPVDNECLGQCRQV